MLWLAVCILVMIISKSRLRLWALYFGIAFLTFGAYDAYLTGWFSKPAAQLVNFSLSDPAYFQPHSILGIAPKKNIQVRAKKSYDSKLIYDVTYTIDSSGLRIGHPASVDMTPSVLFFGGSFTFGEGIEDEETLSYQLEEKSNGRFKSFNFGFHGYGPHQMLAILENELERDDVRNHPPRYVVYQAIPGHVQRCIGRSYWDKSGPRYVLNKEGNIEYTGPFQNWFVSNAIRVMTRSSIIRRWLGSSLEITSADIDLFIGIVKKSEQIIKNRYGSKFYVLLWNNGNWLCPEILSRLKVQNINVIDLNDTLSDYHTNYYKYHIPIDGHPNSLAYQKVAEYLISILPKE